MASKVMASKQRPANIPSVAPPERAPGHPGESWNIDLDAESVESLCDATAYDLSVALDPHGPVLPFHVPLTLVLHQRHGDTTRPEGGSFANEVVTMSLHCGTHIDAVGHYSREGRVFGGCAARDIESSSGLTTMHAAHLPIYFTRAVLFDVPRFRGKECLDAGEGIDSSTMSALAEEHGLTIAPGTVALVRTGWVRNWNEPRKFSGQEGGYPGLDVSAARWLVEKQVAVVGGDTPSVEVAPSRTSVHAALIADHGIPLVENLYLEELAADAVRHMVICIVPLKFVGATGSPVRPIAFGRPGM